MNKYPISAQRLQQIETAFTYHAPKGDQYERYEEIRSTARTFSKILVVNCPEGRDLSLALTALEETVMRANAAIARGEADEDMTVTKQDDSRPRCSHGRIIGGDAGFESFAGAVYVCECCKTPFGTFNVGQKKCWECQK